ncbi:HAD domain-containing protein [Comamonas testosteroni]|uniref:HAD domain-containing protein n=1 Tax=Comamonas testosteroni TaxID=285 RepID=UPI0028E85A31|nr:HAD domain-containing protein [Comamonas testosteroni]
MRSGRDGFRGRQQALRLRRAAGLRYEGALAGSQGRAVAGRCPQGGHLILFLDFDGVLHPSQVVMGEHGPALIGDGALFMWADNLAPLLAAHPHVQLVLSTSWARHLPFEQVRDFLPVALRRRVVGSTWHRIQTDPAFSHGLPYSYWQDATRYQQVRRWVTLHRLRRWASIDDDADGWADADRPRLIHTRADSGLSDPAALSRLAELLRGQP